METIGNYEELSDNVMLNFNKKNGHHHHDNETAKIDEEMETCSPAMETIDLISHQPVVSLNYRQF